MAADVQIRFRAESKQAQREINQLEKEVQGLGQQLGTTEKAADAAGNEIRQMGNQSRQAAEGVDRLGDEAKEAQIGVTSLGRSIFKTSADAKRFGGVFLDQHGIIRESNGNFARTRETIDKLGDEARESAREVDLLGDQLEKAGRGTTGFTRGTDTASRGSRVFTRALGGIGRALGAFGIASAGRLLAEFGTSSVKAAGELEQYIRATEQITGSAEAAAARIASLEEIANLPGLNFEALTRFSNRLIAAGVSGSDADKILLTVGQTVVSLGGDASKAALAMEQLIQAIQLGTIDMRDFRTIVQQIPGFLEVLGDVHGVAANLDGLHDAFDRVGGNMRDLLIPTFDELARRYESPPPDSYIVSIDRLHNSFFLLRAELGEKVLPAVSATARGLADLFDGVRDFLDSGLPTQTATDFAIALEKINSAASRQQSIEDRVNALRRLELALKAERSGLSESSDEYLALSKQIQAAQTEQDRWNTILEGSPQAAAALESEIAGLNERFQTLNDRLNQTEGTRTAASLAQTQRQFDDVSASLSLANKLLEDVQSGFEETAAATDEGTAATRGFISTVGDFGGVLNEADTRFLTYHERVAAYTTAIRALPPEMTAVRGAFDVLAPTAERVNAIFTTYNETLNRFVATSGVVFTNLEKEREELEKRSQEILQQTQDAEGLAHVYEVLAQRTDAHNAALVNPAVSDAVQSFRDFSHIIGDVNLSYEKIVPITQDFADGLGRQASAFDTLRRSVDGTSASSDKLAGELLDVNNALDDLDRSVQASAGELGLIDGIFSTLSEHTEIFQDIAITAFDELSYSVRSAGNEIDTVGESLLAVSDIAARVATGDITALIQAPFRVGEINAQNTEISQQRRLQRRDAAIDERTRVGAADQNLAILAQALGIPIGRLDISEAPHTIQGPLRINDFTGTDLEDLSRNLFSGRSDIAGGIAASLERAIENSDLDEHVARSIATLAVNLDRAITSSDLEPIFREFVDNFEGDISGVSRLLADLGLPHLIGDLFDKIQAEINAAALAAEPLPSSNRFNLLQRLQAGRPAFGATLADPIDDQERGVVATRGGVLVGDVAAAQGGGAAAADINTSLLRNVLERTQFGFGGATDEADFEARRQTLINAINAFYDAEEHRIASLMLSETELQNQREDNALARERALRSATEATNQFAEERIRNEERVASETARIAEEQAREAERLAEEQAREQARLAEEARRAEEAAAQQAQRDAQISVNLQQNAAQRAQFGLGGATDEADFERRRQTAILATNAYYDAELERIQGLQLAENELRDQREDNELARQRALERLTTQTNQFTADRIRAEEQAAAAAERLAEQQAREAERAAAAAAREAERLAEQQAREAERLAEQQARLAEEARRAEEAAAQERERQAQRDAQISVNLQQNAAQRAQFALGGATSEADFEARRQNAILATNAYYAAELERIRGLQLAENELRDQREDNELARQRALERLTTQTNQFTADRIRAEEQAAAETERRAEQQAREAERLAEQQAREAERAEEQAARARVEAERQAITEVQALEQNVLQRAQFAFGGATDEQDFETQRQNLINAINTFYDAEEARIDALEASENRLRDLREDNALSRARALRDVEGTTNRFEQDRIREAERVAQETQRIEESAAQDRIREEMRVSDAISDLQADALEAYEDFENRKVEIAERSLLRIEDLETDSDRRRQDSRIDYQRAIQDLHAETAREIEALGLGTEATERATGSVLSGLASSVSALGLSGDTVQALLDIQTELNQERGDVATAQRREFEDIQLREARGVEDVMLTEQRALVALGTTRNETLVEISEKLSTLLDAGIGGQPFPALSAGDELNATIMIQYPTGAITELRDQIVRLQTQSRSL